MAYDPSVWQAQDLLARFGFNPTGNVDGLWGPITLKSVRDFRLANQLPIDVADDSKAGNMDEDFAMALSKWAAMVGVKFTPAPATPPLPGQSPPFIGPPVPPTAETSDTTAWLIAGGLALVMLGLAFSGRRT
jgi:peptidoglycan hydrolase-like protein with peptidoglycan-binding domain